MTFITYLRVCQLKDDGEIKIKKEAHMGINMLNYY